MAQFTKKAIMQCFIQMLNESPMDKISVVDIAERCGINRNTFYYYYCDIYALVKELFTIEAQRIAEKELSCATWQEVCLEALEFVRENRRAVYHLFHSNHRDLLEEYLYDVAHLEMVNFVRREAEGMPVKEEDINSLALFYTSALVGLVTRWMLEGMKADVESILDNIGRLITGNLRMSLERSCEESCREAEA
ncbi:MAG: TetR/AcrR family transcriptional regulator [Clostridiales bacterium]|nr:TetR/AcrR family transcriptional regulator [Clostridiales bacterium]